MNRDLTINLKINAPTGENAKAASDAVAAVTTAARAGTAANTALAQSNQTVATTASAAAASARSLGQTIVTQSQSARTAASGNREYASSMERLDRMSSDLESGLKDLNDQLNKMEADRKRQIAAEREYFEGISRMVGGVTSLARSVVLLTAANEEDAASMLRMIARFESAAQAVRGLISVVQGATKAWTVYAAAAAAAGGTATLSGFAGFGLSSIGGGIATAAGVVGSAAGTAAGYIPQATAGTYAGSFGLPAVYQAFGIGESEGFINQGYTSAQRWEDPFVLLGSTWNARSNERISRAGIGRIIAQGQYANSQRAPRDRYALGQFQQQQALYGADFSSQYMMAGAGLEGGARGIATADAGLAAVRARQAEIGNIDERSSLGLQAEQRSAVRQLLEQEMQLELQRNEARMQAAQEEIQTARQRLSIAQQEAEVARQRLGMIRTGLSGMNPGEQNELIRAVDRADRGENLNLRDRQAIRRAGLRGYDDVIQQSEEADIARNPRLAQIYAREQGINKPIEANVKAQSELVIKLEQNLETQKPIWQAEILSFLERQAIAIREALKAEMDAGFRAAEERARLSSRAQQAPGGGGPMLGSF